MVIKEETAVTEVTEETAEEITAGPADTTAGVGDGAVASGDIGAGKNILR